MRAPSPPLEVTGGQREVLERLAASHTAPHREVQTARALLAAGDGRASTAIAGELGVSPATVRSWRDRFEVEGLAGVGVVKPGRGRKPTISDEQVADIVRTTLTQTPQGHTHWSCRTMAEVKGVSSASVQRIWSELGIKPHRTETFKVSTDPLFEQKLIDVVGLYLEPPEKAIVLCMDEKSQIQALDRTQPSLPIKPGRAGTMTHDYRRNGTTTLFAALEVATGKVIGECLPRHRHQDFIRFLNTVNRNVPKRLPVHLILDNYGTHRHDKVQKWLARHRRFHFHFTPTSSSWLNLVERWFAALTDKAIRRASFGSVPELVSAIETYLDVNNRDPQPLVWTATAESILDKVTRARATLEAVRQELQQQQHG